MFYKIDENKNVVPATRDEFAVFCNDIENKTVKREDYKNLHVSTVFLGLSHEFNSSKPGKFFETMIFDSNRFESGDIDYQTRCDTWNEALKMHDAAKKYIDKELESE